MLMAGEVGVFFENDGPAPRLWPKLQHSGKTRSGNCEVASFRRGEPDVTPRAAIMSCEDESARGTGSQCL
jgi:hypothetical protein